MRRLSIVLALVVTLGVGACGNSSKKGTDTTSSGSAPVKLTGTVNNHGGKDLSGSSGSASVELEQDDFYFSPTFIKAAPSQKVEVEVKNEGKVTHTFTIDSLSVDQEVPAGSTKTVTLTLPASGAVAFYCRFHKGQGMQGALYFKAGTTASDSNSGSSSGNGY